MRFAYIDSQGNEVSIPSVDALALRIELGAIGPETELYDAQADRWGPADSHEIFHTLSRDAGEEGFVAPPPPVPPPPPVAPPPVEEAPEADAEDTEAAPAPAAWDVASDLGGLAEAGAGLDPDDSDDEEAEGDFGLTLADAPGGAAAPAAEAPPEPASDDPGFGDLSFDLAAPGEATPAAAPQPPEAPEPEPAEAEAAFDFGGFDGSLAVDEPEEPAAAEPAATAAPAGDDDGIALQSPMDFAGGGDAGGGLDLETPMSEFTPDSPPSWMEDDDPTGAEDTMSFASPATEEKPISPAPRRRSGAGGDDMEVPRRRPEPKNRPSPPRRRKKQAPVGAIMGVVALAAVAGGGYFAWTTFMAGGGGSADDAPTALPPVVIPDIPAELLPQMRDLAEAALSATLDELRARRASLEIPSEPNPDWLSGNYLANASRFPDIEEFWIGIETFLDEVRTTDTQIFHAKYVEQVEAAGVPADTAALLIERADSGFLAARDDRIAAYNLMDDLVNSALNLHDFLIDNEAEIEYQPSASGLSADPVLEAVPSSEAIEEAMLGHVAEITRALADLGTLDRVTTERLFAVLFDRIRRAGIE